MSGRSNGCNGDGIGRIEEVRCWNIGAEGCVVSRVGRNGKSGRVRV